jgi:hypothetical protein
LPYAKAPGFQATKFLLTVGIGWILLAAAGVYYARIKSVPTALATPIIAAFLIEYVFYLVPGFEGLRNWLADHIPVRALALALALSALAPYLLYSLATGQFRADLLSRLAALVFAISFWYVWQRPSPIADLCILAVIAAPLITRFFHHIYTSPIPWISLDILGKLMLIRLVASVMLIFREVEGTGFGFLPTAREWKIGLRYFVYFLPVGLALSMTLRLIHFHASLAGAATAPLLFLGVLWTLALWEEFLARGLLQRWISDWTRRENLGLIVASVIFGLCHLWFHTFPDWKQAIVAGALGWFCGKAYIRGEGIRAAMVTHALVVTVLKTFLS